MCGGVLQNHPWLVAQDSRRQLVHPLAAGRRRRGRGRGLRWRGVGDAAAAAGLGVRQDVLVHGLQVLHHVAGARARLVVHLLVADAANDFVAAQLDEGAPGHGLVFARHVVVVVVQVEMTGGGLRPGLGPGLGPRLRLRARRLRRHRAAAADH